MDYTVAQDRLSLVDDRSLREAVSAAIFDGRSVGGLGFQDLQPEDIFIPILARSDCSRRSTVLAGCRDVCVRFYQLLSDVAAENALSESNLAESA